MSFSKKLKFYIKNRGYNTISLGKILNVSAGAIGFWQNGSRFPRKPQTIEKLINILDITAIDLFGDKEKQIKRILSNEVEKNLDKYVNHLPKNLIPNNIKIIPIIKDENLKYIYIDKIILKKEYRDKDLKAIRVKDNSMSPYLNYNDIAIYYPIKQITLNNGVYIINIKNIGLTIRRVKFLINGKISFISDNSLYRPNEELTKNDLMNAINIEGLVINRILKN